MRVCGDGSRRPQPRVRFALGDDLAYPISVTEHEIVLQRGAEVTPAFVQVLNDLVAAHLLDRESGVGNP